MEGVGARLGRSSTRYGPAPVFTGPVRKWKKKWVNVSSSSSSSSSSTQNHRNGVNGSSGNGGHLSFYKWTPITPSQNNVNGETKEDQVAPPLPSSSVEDERPKRRFKYVPIAVLEEQNNEAEEYEAAEQDDEKDKESDIDPNAAEATAKMDGADEKPDMNDVPMEESQDINQVVRQDLNESTLDLSLGLNGHEGDHDSSPKAEQSRDGELDKTHSSSAT